MNKRLEYLPVAIASEVLSLFHTSPAWLGTQYSQRGLCGAHGRRSFRASSGCRLAASFGGVLRLRVLVCTGDTGSPVAEPSNNRRLTDESDMSALRSAGEIITLEPSVR